MEIDAQMVLDASAILALLYGEPGAKVVETALARDAVISTVNLAEVVGRLSVRGWQAAEIDKALSLRCRVVEFDAGMARCAGDLAATGQRHGLSLGDRACLATAMMLGIRSVLTADSIWKKLKFQSLRIMLIR